MANDTATLEIKMFGTFDILLDGQSVIKNNKHSNKIFEMLKYMIINNNKELNPELICENIWPDSEYLDVRNTVSTYIFRLNKFLKSESDLNYNLNEDLVIVCLKGNYKLILSERCNLDVKVFDYLYAQSEKESDHQQKLIYLKEAIYIYKGELFQEFAINNWIIPFRNYYRRVYSDICREALLILFLSKDFKTILKICSLIFEIYPLDDFANIYYLKALQSLNHTKEAEAHYEYICTKYMSEQGSKPSEEMQQILLDANTNDSSNLSIESNTLAKYSHLFSDSSEFWNIFSNMIDGFMEKKTEQKLYSIGYAELHADTDMSEALDAFYKSIESVLRKEDYYSFFEPNIIIFVLVDVTDVLYPFIIERIEKFFKKEYEKEATLSIVINPCLNYDEWH